MKNPTKKPAAAKPTPLPYDVVDPDPDRMDQVRRLRCVRYDDCLDVAIACDWQGFHCQGCNAFVPLSEAEEARDRVGLRVLHDLPELAERERRNGERRRRREEREVLAAPLPTTTKTDVAA